jgi:hypothetical protein
VLPALRADPPFPGPSRGGIGRSGDAEREPKESRKRS